MDRANHKPRGFGFVTMATPEGARSAIQALNGKAIETGTLIVSEAGSSEESASSPSGRWSPRRSAS